MTKYRTPLLMTGEATLCVIYVSASKRRDRSRCIDKKSLARLSRASLPTHKMNRRKPSSDRPEATGYSQCRCPR